MEAEMTAKILRRTEVERVIGLSRSTIYKAMTENTFPKPIRIGKRAVGWRQADIMNWLETRPQAHNDYY
ncbi:helix-turn-helix transcriptional regulator [Sphingosinicella sp.]|uniref:helix-turn-helix transcriptional regulator n=1 Tax=Sphingosinicella sp. TaxID=1917971 RepID=UPI0035B2D885